MTYRMFQISINSEHFYSGTNFGRTGGKYLIKIIFDTKIEIRMFEMSIVLNFNKF